MGRAHKRRQVCAGKLQVNQGEHFQTNILCLYILYFSQNYQQSDQEDHENLFELIRNMLMYEPTDRISLDQVLR